MPFLGNCLLGTSGQGNQTTHSLCLCCWQICIFHILVVFNKLHIHYTSISYYHHHSVHLSLQVLKYLIDHFIVTMSNTPCLSCARDRYDECLYCFCTIYGTFGHNREHCTERLYSQCGQRHIANQYPMDNYKVGYSSSSQSTTSSEPTSPLQETYCNICSTLLCRLF